MKPSMQHHKTAALLKSQPDTVSKHRALATGHGLEAPAWCKLDTGHTCLVQRGKKGQARRHCRRWRCTAITTAAAAPSRSPSPCVQPLQLRHRPRHRPPLPRRCCHRRSPSSSSDGLVERRSRPRRSEAHSLNADCLHAIERTRLAARPAQGTSGEELAAGAGTGSEGSLCQKACAADTRTSKYPKHNRASSFGHAVWAIVAPSPPHSIRALWPSLL